MPDVLPKGKIPVMRVNPRIMLLYSSPKAGKTEALSMLEDCKTLATEDGVEMYSMDYLRITSISGGTTYHPKGHLLEGQIHTTSLDNFIAMMNAEGARQIAANEPLKLPYKFIAVDTIDELETMCEVSATVKYKKSVIGKNFEGRSVLELPDGGGYYHLRNELLSKIEILASFCKYLILVSHIRDKVMNKGGVSVEIQDISLTGKLGQMVAARCDVIGYMYREPNKPPLVSFVTYERSAMGSRFKRLAGKTMEFSWKEIYLPE